MLPEPEPNELTDDAAEQQKELFLLLIADSNERAEAKYKEVKGWLKEFFSRYQVSSPQKWVRLALSRLEAQMIENLEPLSSNSKSRTKPSVDEITKIAAPIAETILKDHKILEARQMARFLARLDPDKEKAGERWQRLEGRLLLYLKGRKVSQEKELADEAIDKLMEKIDEEEEQQIPEDKRIRSPEAMAMAIVKILVKKYWNSRQREEVLLKDPERIEKSPFLPVPKVENESRRLECLWECLGKLPLIKRNLVIEYYDEQPHEPIEIQRQRLADQYGHTRANLATNACRIRKELFDCVEDCLKKKAA